MPDVHSGKSGPCGLVATIGNYVCPEHIGVDIGCTVSMLILDKHIPVEKYADFEHKIKVNIPFGTKINYRNVKNEETGKWEKVPYYMIEDKYPFGHGEKSVFLIERFMKLKIDEAISIRWHMGGFDDAVRGGSFCEGNTFERYPLAVMLHIADIEATYLVEGNK
jgi:hypothetical protein